MEVCTIQVEDKESIASPHPPAPSSFLGDLRLAPGVLRTQTRDDSGPGSVPPSGTGVTLLSYCFSLCKNSTTINSNSAVLQKTAFLNGERADGADEVLGQLEEEAQCV